MTEPIDDIPPGVDFHDPNACAEWASEAAEKRPWRTRYFEHFAAAIEASTTTHPTVLELGSGPGFLAEHLLGASPNIKRYTLLDFAKPMLNMSRARLHVHAARTHFVQADFRLPSCASLAGPFDFVVSMQAVHELRHKRHATALYSRVRELLTRGGVFLVCDHLPGKEPSPTRRALYMTLAENCDALAAGGFTQVRCVEHSHDMVLIAARA